MYPFQPDDAVTLSRRRVEELRREAERERVSKTPQPSQSESEPLLTRLGAVLIAMGTRLQPSS
ncbi:MAG: hypothetical protein GXY76_02985 [Chloroflexi bacterium]|nr:hypothetical protein [Chloroflexota bacterium]